MTRYLHEFLLRLKALLSKGRMDHDMAEELAFHQAMLKEKLVRQGLTPKEADAETRRRFGRASRWHERLRELWQFRRLENLMRDVSYSARVLRHSPGFTVIAILTLALGVGANTTVFSMINGLLLRPLAVPASHELVLLGINDGGPQLNYSISEPLFRGLERRRQVFSEVFAFNHAAMQVKGDSGSENVQGQLVSGGFFPALQTAPLLGRILTSADDAPGGNPAGFGVVITEGFWRRRFNLMPNVIGQKLEIDNTLFTVVGVMPKRFIGADPLQRPELFVPIAAEPIMHGARSLVKGGFHTWWLTVMARLQTGATLAQADGQVSASSNAVLHEAIPDSKWIAEREKRHFHFIAESGATGFTYVRLYFRKPLIAVFAMCGGILLLACLNLASLLMARGTARQKELATRLAMGATRRRLVQQLLIESLLIAIAGTAAGLAMAPFVSQSLSAILLSGQYGTHVDTSLDLRVFAFAALAAIVAALLIGLVPALQATAGSLNEHMKHGQHTTLAKERRAMLPRAMMAGEVALALMLVVGAGLLASSLVRLYKSGAGFEPSGLENIALDMDQQPLTGDPLMQFYRQLEEGLSHQPGVKDVSLALMVPFTHFVWDESFSAAAAGKTYDLYQNSVGPGYFQTMRIPMRSGRDFGWNDRPSTGFKIILNQAAVKLLFPDRDPIGQFVNKHEGDRTVPYQVVAVVGDAKYEDLRSDAPPTGYVPITQENGQHSRSYVVVVRTGAAAGPLVGAAHALASQVNPEIPMPVITSMSSTVDDSLSAERTMALLAMFFAACALVVTAIGLYGVLAYATARRSSEIGIRMALGARRTQVAGMVLWQNATAALAGTIIGVAAALLASRALASFLYGISTRDPWVFAGSIMAMAALAIAASLLPAIRAAGIEPMKAIRCE